MRAWQWVGGLAGIAAAVLQAPAAADVPLASGAALADFDVFCHFVAERYAYFDKKKSDWPRTCAVLRGGLSDHADRAELMSALEAGLAELYDSHAHLGASNAHSPRLIPTNAQVWARWDGASAWVGDVRADSPAQRAGVRAGERLVQVDGVPIAEAARVRHPRYLRGEDPEADAWALQMALAGVQDGKPLRLRLERDGVQRDVSYAPDQPASASLLDAKELPGGFVQIRFHNSLGNPDTIAAFDAALDAHLQAPGIVLDLRDTASGGTSIVAKGIMGRLVAVESAYQRHEDITEFVQSGVRHRWVEWVSPRGTAYTGPVVVLAGHWTGSMGEGIAIGLNAARKAPVMGTTMARLLGALDETRLPASGIVVRVPAERLTHLDGTPRESFQPEAVNTGGTVEDDAAVEAARLRLAR